MRPTAYLHRSAVPQWTMPRACLSTKLLEIALSFSPRVELYSYYTRANHMMISMIHMMKMGKLWPCLEGSGGHAAAICHISVP